MDLVLNMLESSDFWDVRKVLKGMSEFPIWLPPDHLRIPPNSQPYAHGKPASCQPSTKKDGIYPWKNRSVCTRCQLKPLILWMDKILHHLKNMGNHCLLVCTGESSFQGFLGGAKWISPIHSMEGFRGAPKCLPGSPGFDSLSVTPDESTEKGSGPVSFGPRWFHWGHKKVVCFSFFFFFSSFFSSSVFQQKADGEFPCAP